MEPTVLLMVADVKENATLKAYHYTGLTNQVATVQTGCNTIFPTENNPVTQLPQLPRLCVSQTTSAPKSH